MSDNDTLVHEVPARLRLSGTDSAPAVARIAERARHWRTTAALKELAIWWGLMVVTVFIPVLHFISVPILFLVGIWRAYSRLSEARTLLALHGTCPHCGTEQDFPDTGALKESPTVNCASCRWELKLEVPLTDDTEGSTRGGATAGR